MKLQQTGPWPGRMGLRPPEGVLAIVGTVFLTALTDAIIKQSSAGMSLWQIWLLRSCLVLPVMCVMARGQLLAPKAGWVALRSLLLIGMYLSMYSALPFMDMALAGAAVYTAPLFIVGLSALVLGNRITAGHWLAILTGFAGLLLIVRPYDATFTPLVVLPVVAAICYACAAVITRAKCSDVAPAVMGLWLNVAFLIIGGAVLALLPSDIPRPAADFPLLFATWRPMLPGDWAMIVILAMLIVGATMGFAKAYQSPQPEIVATFDYCYVIFASFWGYVFFGEIPDRWTMAGMILIVAGGLGILMADKSGRRRRDASRRAAPQPGTHARMADKSGRASMGSTSG